MVETVKVRIAATRGRWLAALTGAYALLVLLVLVLLRWVGESWWGTVALLFAPRWVLLAPIALLALLSAFRRCFRHWVAQGATALVIAGPIMGFNLPTSSQPTAPGAETLRVVTFNLSLHPVRAEEFLGWVESERVDLVCFQEGKREEDALRRQFREAGWHLSARRSIASRLPIVEEWPIAPGTSQSEERYPALLERARLRTSSGADVVVASVHLPTLRVGLQQLLDSRDPRGLETHLAWWRGELGRVLSELASVGASPLIVAGDFNMPSDDATMASLRVNFRFAFEEAGWGYGYTKPADYPWVRIDHVLTGPDWTVNGCRVGPDFGSDHLPLLAEITLSPQRR